MIRRLLLAGAACAAGIVVMAPIAASAETATPRQAAATAQADGWGNGWGNGGWGHHSGRPWHGGYWGSPLGYWNRPLGYWAAPVITTPVVTTPVVTAPVVLVDNSLASDCGAANNAVLTTNCG
ncbi:hypothetical protein AB0C14_19120 [Microbispora hainanensis]|uniref:hypothetical protein n=1 Tax=Microbispora hainanensis TaxID=568844 RepID=UPI0033EC95E0